MGEDTIICIDWIPSSLLAYPNYCRNMEDRGRWLAWKLGLVDKISPDDECKVNSQRMTFEIRVKNNG